MRSAFGERLAAAVESVKGGFLTKARSTTITVGVNTRTRLLAAELEAAGKEVSLISLETESLGDSEVCAASVLKRARAGTAQTVVAATSSDSLNLVLCRTARDQFSVPLVITRMKLLEGVTSWAKLNEAGTVRLAWTEVVSEVLGGITPRDSFLRIASAGDDELIAEVEMLSPALVGRTIADLQWRGCEAVALRRKDSVMPSGDGDQIRLGDVIALVGRKDAIDQVRESLISL